MRDSSWRCSVARACIKNTTKDVGLQPCEKNSRAKKAKPDANSMSREPVVENCIEPVNTRILRRLARESFSSTPKVVNPLQTDKKKEDVILESRTCGRETWKEARCIRSCECEPVGGHDKSYSPYNNLQSTLTDTKAKESGFQCEGTITGPGVLYSGVGVDSRKVAAMTEVEFQNLKSTAQNFQTRREVYAVNPRGSSPNEQFRNLKTSCLRESVLSPSPKAEQSKESKKLSNVDLRSTIGASSDEGILEENPRNVSCARVTSRDQLVKGESRNVSWGKMSTSTPNAQAVSKEIPRNLLYEIGVSEGAHSQSPRLTCLGKSTQQKLQTSKPKSFMPSAVQEWGAQDSSLTRSVTPAAFSLSHRFPGSNLAEAKILERTASWPRSIIYSDNPYPSRKSSSMEIEITQSALLEAPVTASRTVNHHAAYTQPRQDEDNMDLRSPKFLVLQYDSAFGSGRGKELGGRVYLTREERKINHAATKMQGKQQEENEATYPVRAHKLDAHGLHKDCDPQESGLYRNGGSEKLTGGEASIEATSMKGHRIGGGCGLFQINRKLGMFLGAEKAEKELASDLFVSTALNSNRYGLKEREIFQSRELANNAESRMTDAASKRTQRAGERCNCTQLDAVSRKNPGEGRFRNEETSQAHQHHRILSDNNIRASGAHRQKNEFQFSPASVKRSESRADVATISSPGTTLSQWKGSVPQGAVATELELDLGPETDDLEFMLDFLKMKKELREKARTSPRTAPSEDFVQEMLQLLKLKNSPQETLSMQSWPAPEKKQSRAIRCLDDTFLSTMGKREEDGCPQTREQVGTSQHFVQDLTDLRFHNTSSPAQRLWSTKAPSEESDDVDNEYCQASDWSSSNEELKKKGYDFRQMMDWSQARSLPPSDGFQSELSSNSCPSATPSVAIGPSTSAGSGIHEFGEQNSSNASSWSQKKLLTRVGGCQCRNSSSLEGPGDSRRLIGERKERETAAFNRYPLKEAEHSNGSTSGCGESQRNQSMSGEEGNQFHQILETNVQIAEIVQNLDRQAVRQRVSASSPSPMVPLAEALYSNGSSAAAYESIGCSDSEDHIWTSGGIDHQQYPVVKKVQTPWIANTTSQTFDQAEARQTSGKERTVSNQTLSVLPSSVSKFPLARPTGNVAANRKGASEGHEGNDHHCRTESRSQPKGILKTSSKTSKNQVTTERISARNQNVTDQIGESEISDDLIEVYPEEFVGVGCHTYVARGGFVMKQVPIEKMDLTQSSNKKASLSPEMSTLESGMYTTNSHSHLQESVTSNNLDADCDGNGGAQDSVENKIGMAFPTCRDSPTALDTKVETSPRPEARTRTLSPTRLQGPHHRSPERYSTKKATTALSLRRASASLEALKKAPNLTAGIREPVDLASPRRRSRPTGTFQSHSPTETSSKILSEEKVEDDNISERNFPAGVSGVVQESIALAKDSNDPYADFHESMVEMMKEKNLCSRQDLEDLLQCFLHLNAPVYHDLIQQAFNDVCYDQVKATSVQSRALSPALLEKT